MHLMFTDVLMMEVELMLYLYSVRQSFSNSWDFIILLSISEMHTRV